MFKKLSSEKGFTLLEIILTVILVGTISIVINNAQLAGWKVWNAGQQVITQQQKVRLFTTQLTKDSKSSEKIKIKNNSKKLIIEDKEDKIEYYLENGTIIRQQKQKKKILTDVEEIKFNKQGEQFKINLRLDNKDREIKRYISLRNQ
ncbi:MAG: prepilin-type N-terminal cleavage/methylation domain-containing protein [Halanaerobacter sp.]